MSNPFPDKDDFSLLTNRQLLKNILVKGQIAHDLNFGDMGLSIKGLRVQTLSQPFILSVDWQVIVTSVMPQLPGKNVLWSTLPFYFLLSTNFPIEIYIGDELASVVENGINQFKARNSINSISVKTETTRFHITL